MFVLDLVMSFWRVTTFVSTMLYLVWMRRPVQPGAVEVSVLPGVEVVVDPRHLQTCGSASLVRPVVGVTVPLTEDDKPSKRVSGLQ